MLSPTSTINVVPSLTGFGTLDRWYTSVVISHSSAAKPFLMALLSFISTFIVAWFTVNPEVAILLLESIVMVPLAAFTAVHLVVVIPSKLPELWFAVWLESSP